MKIIVIALLLCFAMSYKRERAVEYARQYCRSYNRNYINYAELIGDSANYVSQCLLAGGVNLGGCAGRDSHGAIPIVSNLRTCLASRGWKNTLGYNSRFLDGYPFFLDNDEAYIATQVVGKNIKYCAHAQDSGFKCDTLLGSNLQQYRFYYL